MYHDLRPVMKYSITDTILIWVRVFCAFLLASRPYFDSAGSVPILMRAFTPSSFCSRLDFFFCRDLSAFACSWLLPLGGVFFGGCFFGRYGTRREEALAHKTGRVQCRLERLRFKSCHSSEPSKGTHGKKCSPGYYIGNVDLLRCYK